MSKYRIEKEEMVEKGQKINIKEIGDPYVLRVNDMYYLYATCNFDGFYCWSSKDLINWNEPQICYEKNQDSFGKSLFWAPEVYSFGNKYYMYYTAQWKKYQTHSLRIGVAVADHPTGPFRDVQKTPMFDFGYGVLDAHILKDEKENYLYFSRACEDNVLQGEMRADIYMVKLSEDYLSVIGKPVCILKPDQVWERQYHPERKMFWTEGPFVLKYENKYHLMYSANFFASEFYGIGAAVANTPWGPFVKYESNPILKTTELISGPGHNSVVKDQEGAFICVYHAHSEYKEKGGNRQVYVTPLNFVDGWIHLEHPNS